ncbi:MAG TPA: LCP family protein [Thermoanaerobaculia bacterium]|jgi:LCP family protein required for cell wall assembly|nr:LCP family protein [Thermoanaerobaculia bacterium]
MTTEILTPAYSRLDPDASARMRRRSAAEALPTPAQKTVEYTLFGVFGLTIALAGVALYAVNSPEHQWVPNAFEEGIRGGRANVLIMETTTPQTPSRTTRIDGLTVVSIKGDTHEAALISIPASLWVKVGRYGTHRLAAAAAIGNSSGYPGEGAGLTVDTVSEVIGQPIHSYVRIESSRLKETIDALGGIDVQVRNGHYVERTHDRFRPGLQHMDGARAVRYAHSPNLFGREGSRELRQQEVLTAVFTKLQTAGPKVRQQVLLAAQGEPMSNMTPDQLARLVSSFGNSPSLRHVSLRPLLDPFEVETFGDEGGQALRPKRGDFAEVQKLAREIFAEQGSAAAASLTH